MISEKLRLRAERLAGLLGLALEPESPTLESVRLAHPAGARFLLSFSPYGKRGRIVLVPLFGWGSPEGFTEATVSELRDDAEVARELLRRVVEPFLSAYPGLRAEQQERERREEERKLRVADAKRKIGEAWGGERTGDRGGERSRRDDEDLSLRLPMLRSGAYHRWCRLSEDGTRVEIELHGVPVETFCRIAQLLREG